MTSRTRIWLVVILVVAAAVRIAWSLYAARPPSQSLHDPNFYLLYGEQIARGHVRVSDRLVRLPFYTDMTDAEQSEVIAAVSAVARV